MTLEVSRLARPGVFQAPDFPLEDDKGTTSLKVGMSESGHRWQAFLAKNKRPTAPNLALDT